MKTNIYKGLCLFILWAVLFNPNASSQNTFFKFYLTNTHDQAHSIIELSNGNFVIVGSRSLNNQSMFKRNLIKCISSNGSEIDELLSNDSSSAIFRSYSKIIRSPLNAGKYFVFGYHDTQFSTVSYQLEITELSFSPIQKSNSVYFKAPDNEIFIPQNAILVGDSLIFVVCYKQDLSTGENGQLALTKFKINLDSVTTYITPGPLYRLPNSIIFDQKYSFIKAGYYGAPILDTNNTSTHVLNFDINLNLISDHSFPLKIIMPEIVGFSDSLYLLTSTIHSLPDTADHIVTCFLNKNDSIIKKIEISNNIDTVLYATDRGSTIINGNSIFITGIYNMVALGIGWQQTPSWIQVTRMDHELNRISDHFYGGDAYYQPMSSTATNDGGYCITGYRYDFNSPNNPIYNIFVLKTDSLGIATGIEDNQTDQAQTILIYPNPVKDFLNIVLGRQYESAIVEIFNINGSLIYSKNLEKGNNQISISDLTNGTFIYKIVNKSEQIAVGKFIKIE